MHLAGASVSYGCISSFYLLFETMLIFGNIVQINTDLRVSSFVALPSGSAVAEKFAGKF